MSAHVYILARRRNGTLYVGMTTNLAARITAHKQHLVAGFARRYGMDKLVHVETYDSILEARARERSLKRWHRKWKLELIEAHNPDWRDLADQI
jgi:putative endonuclease